MVHSSVGRVPRCPVSDAAQQWMVLLEHCEGEVVIRARLSKTHRLVVPVTSTALTQRADTEEEDDGGAVLLSAKVI